MFEEEKYIILSFSWVIAFQKKKRTNMKVCRTLEYNIYIYIYCAQKWNRLGSNGCKNMRKATNSKRNIQRNVTYIKLNECKHTMWRLLRKKFNFKWRAKIYKYIYLFVCLFCVCVCVLLIENWKNIVAAAEVGGTKCF